MRTLRVAHVATLDATHRFLLLDQLRGLRDAGFEVTSISAPGPWVAGIEAEGIRHLRWVHAGRAGGPRAAALAVAELVGILRRERFDLVHTHDPALGITGRLAARLAGTPCVVNTADGPSASPADPALAQAALVAIERLAARLSDLELYRSEEDLARARTAGIAGPERSALLGEGVDLGRFDPGVVPRGRLLMLRRRLLIPAGATVVGTIAGPGAWDEGEVLAAAPRVRAVRPDASFLVVSEPGSPRLNGGRSRSPAPIRVAGGEEDVRDLLALMDVFVLSPRRDVLPHPAIEAAAMARPIVLTDGRVAREVVRHGVDGLVVPRRDPERLAEAITSLVEDPGLRARLGGAARMRALDRFDGRRVVRAVVDRSRELLVGGEHVAKGELPFAVRGARSADAATLARLHWRALPEATMRGLGVPFLTRLYRAVLSDPGAVCLIAHHDGRPVGFAAAVVAVGAFRARLMRRPWLLAASLPWLLRPGVARRVGEAVRFPAGADGDDAELLSIAVAPRWRSRGVGGVVIARIARGLAERGARTVRVVVAPDDRRANRFYERLGFRPAGPAAQGERVEANLWVRSCRS